jgi:formiminotetrahydrofolate cyclodeaminase
LPAEQEQAAIQDAITAANDIALKVNAFIEKDWAAFRKLVEANPIKKFKEVELIK